MTGLPICALVMILIVAVACSGQTPIPVPTSTSVAAPAEPSPTDSSPTSTIPPPPPQRAPGSTTASLQPQRGGRLVGSYPGTSGRLSILEPPTGKFANRYALAHQTGQNQELLHQVPGGGVIGHLSDYTRGNKLPSPCLANRGFSCLGSRTLCIAHRAHWMDMPTEYGDHGAAHRLLCYQTKVVPPFAPFS